MFMVVGVGKMNLTISDELEEKFRMTIAQTLGFKRGNIQIAVEDAIENWIMKKLEENKKNIQHGIRDCGLSINLTTSKPDVVKTYPIASL